jgi:hypothetical protein
LRANVIRSLVLPGRWHNPSAYSLDKHACLKSRPASTTVSEKGYKTHATLDHRFGSGQNSVEPFVPSLIAKDLTNFPPSYFNPISWQAPSSKNSTIRIFLGFVGF